MDSRLDQISVTLNGLAKDQDEHDLIAATITGIMTVFLEAILLVVGGIGS